MARLVVNGLLAFAAASVALGSPLDRPRTITVGPILPRGPLAPTNPIRTFITINSNIIDVLAGDENDLPKVEEQLRLLCSGPHASLYPEICDHFKKHGDVGEFTLWPQPGMSITETETKTLSGPTFSPVPVPTPAPIHTPVPGSMPAPISSADPASLTVLLSTLRSATFGMSPSWTTPLGSSSTSLLEASQPASEGNASKPPSLTLSGPSRLPLPPFEPDHPDSGVPAASPTTDANAGPGSTSDDEPVPIYTQSQVGTVAESNTLATGNGVEDVGGTTQVKTVTSIELRTSVTVETRTSVSRVWQTVTTVGYVQSTTVDRLTKAVTRTSVETITVTSVTLATQHPTPLVIQLPCPGESSSACIPSVESPSIQLPSLGVPSEVSPSEVPSSTALPSAEAPPTESNSQQIITAPGSRLPSVQIFPTGLSSQPNVTAPARIPTTIETKVRASNSAGAPESAVTQQPADEHSTDEHHFTVIQQSTIISEETRVMASLTHIRRPKTRTAGSANAAQSASMSRFMETAFSPSSASPSPTPDLILIPPRVVASARSANGPRLRQLGPTTTIQLLLSPLPTDCTQTVSMGPEKRDYFTATVYPGTVTATSLVKCRCANLETVVIDRRGVGVDVWEPWFTVRAATPSTSTVVVCSATSRF
ncbi:hypothetical protein QBC34DRAFT_383659 [Podospora aff. communis PSN243]|uniref:Uncharacterized protein n=1 Tax=Podospora aff. communis PSN243 TaxID=3040156 RepID=A0AAV9GFG7_9PEZI|nr:hypothetical protein QBC34DRAFT_383659 [Podospora aff. communis PSN243]